MSEPRTKEDIDKDYTHQCAIHGHKAGQVDQLNKRIKEAEKTIARLQHEMGESLKAMNHLNEEALKFMKTQKPMETLTDSPELEGAAL